MKTREQEEKRHEITVGMMIILGIAVIVFVIFAVSRQQGLFEERYELTVHMSRVNGLQTGAPVRLNGVRVGSVTGLGFVNNHGENTIKVTLEIQKNVQDKIRKDSEAYIGTLGLLGDKFISITMGSEDFPILKNGDELMGTDPIDVEKLIDESVVTLNELKKTTVQLKEISEKINRGEGTIGLLVNDKKLYEKLNTSMEMLADMQKELAEGEGTLAQIMRDTTMYDELYTFLKNTNMLTDSLMHGQGSAAQLINNPEMHDEMIIALSTVQEILGKINSGRGTAGQLVNNKKLYGDLLSSIANLDSLLVDIKKSPKKYLTIKVF